MAKPSQEDPDQRANRQPKVTADFGGRRKLLDRRYKRSSIAHKDRRTGKERRCGYDRRGALNQSGENKTDETESLDRRAVPPCND